MINGTPVIDAVVHGFNFKKENLKQPFLDAVVKLLYNFTHYQIHPQGDPRYSISEQEFQDAFDLQPELLEQMMFAESDTDIAIYHGVPMYGLFGDGSSPVWIASKIKEKLPHRMEIYGDISPLVDDVDKHLHRMVEDVGVIGLKFYPADIVKGEIVPVRMNDEKNVWPIIEKARDAGIRVIAVHKAVPLGPFVKPLQAVDDLAPVISAFPDMQFEIVHGGFAFSRETADLFNHYDNVWINLETNPCFCVNMAEKFANMIEPFLSVGAYERLFYATGATGAHPQPTLEAFFDFQMPEGYSPLTAEVKRAILGENFARLHQWNLQDRLAKCEKDKYGASAKLLEQPFHTLPSRGAKQAVGV